MNLTQEITNWDGKSSSDIAAIYQHHKNDNDFLSKLIELAKKEPFQVASSWLLKCYLESGSEIQTNQIAKIYKLLPKLEYWEAKLHLLQCIPFIMTIAKAEKKKVEMFLRQCLMDNNKFVRAWAYNGFYELATQYPEYKDETKQFFEMAMKDEAASVKARIRNIIKKGF